MKSDPIQPWLIIDDGTLITRLIFGENVHMLLSTINVPLPASFFGAVTRTNDFFEPSVHARIDMVRSQDGR